MLTEAISTHSQPARPAFGGHTRTRYRSQTPPPYASGGRLRRPNRGGGPPRLGSTSRASDAETDQLRRPPTPVGQLGRRSRLLRIIAVPAANGKRSEGTGPRTRYADCSAWQRRRRAPRSGEHSQVVAVALPTDLVASLVRLRRLEKPANALAHLARCRSHDQPRAGGCPRYRLDRSGAGLVWARQRETCTCIPRTGKGWATALVSRSLQVATFRCSTVGSTPLAPCLIR